MIADRQIVSSVFRMPCVGLKLFRPGEPLTISPPAIWRTWWSENEFELRRMFLCDRCHHVDRTHGRFRKIRSGCPCIFAWI